MCDAKASARELAGWMAAYCACANSERFDDLVSRPPKLDVPLVCLRFLAQDESEEFDLALPASATVGEVRAALDSLPDGGSPEEHVASRLAGRYEEVGALGHVGRERVAAQLFHANGRYRAFVLVWGERWICSLPMKYSLASDGLRHDFDEDLTLRDVVNMLLENRWIQSSRFTMPREAIEDEYRSLCADD